MSHRIAQKNSIHFSSERLSSEVLLGLCLWRDDMFLLIHMLMLGHAMQKLNYLHTSNALNFYGVLNVKFYQDNMSMMYTCTPLIPHFYLAKLRFAGVYLIFLFLIQNIHCRYSLEPPRRGSSKSPLYLSICSLCVLFSLFFIACCEIHCIL